MQNADCTIDEYETRTVTNTNTNTNTNPNTNTTPMIDLRTPIPGPKSSALLARRKAAVLPGVSTMHPIFIERASGSTVTDVDGNTFIDFTGGIGVMNVGHGQAARHRRRLQASRAVYARQLAGDGLRGLR